MTADNGDYFIKCVTNIEKNIRNDIVPKISKVINDELKNYNSEFLKTKQECLELESKLSAIDLSTIQEFFYRFFELLSDIRQEQFRGRTKDFDQYLVQLQRLTEILGMKIYCYNNGDDIPSDDYSCLEIQDEPTNNEELDGKVSFTDLIGFRVNKLDIKHSGIVTRYKFQPGVEPSLPKLDLTNSKDQGYIQRRLRIACDVYDELEPVFDQYVMENNRSWNQIEGNLCDQFIRIFNRNLTGKQVKIRSMYKASVSRKWKNKKNQVLMRENDDNWS